MVAPDEGGAPICVSFLTAVRAGAGLAVPHSGDEGISCLFPRTVDRPLPPAFAAGSVKTAAGGAAPAPADLV